MDSDRAQLRALHDRVPSAPSAASAAALEEFRALVRSLDSDLPGLAELAHEAVTSNEELHSLVDVALTALQAREDLAAGRPVKPPGVGYARF